MIEEYSFKKIENKWQERWAKEKYGQSKDLDKKPKHYHLVEFPYPSGAGLHVGHCMGYGASDAYCRMKRMQGFNVMYPIGWDAFGLPTENYAIKNKIKPAKATKENVDNFRKQMKALGLAFDWDREVNTTDPEYYKWTQWIFLQFYKHAVVDPEKSQGISGPGGKLVEVADDDQTTPRLAFQAEMPVNWCPSCKIVLANEEVVDGNCERCGTVTTPRKQKQWMLRITAYADRLIKDLDTVDYLKKIKAQQINWIGRSEGILFKHKVRDMSIEFEVYDSIPQTHQAQTFVIIAPEHDLLPKMVKGTSYEKDVLEFAEKIKKKKLAKKFDIDKDMEGIFTGRYVENYLGTGRDVPIWVASFVLVDYGTGIVGCSAHDERDFKFAKKYSIPLKPVLFPTDKEKAELVRKGDIFYREPDGILEEPVEFKGRRWDEARKDIIDWIIKQALGKKAVQFKLRDWIFSRQHYWGEPIPIIHCPTCGTVPVPEDQLPLTLPEVENYEPTDTGESPLAKMTSWVQTKCPICDGDAERETDTMPNWAGSSWYFLRYCDPKNKLNLADEAKLKYWMPVDLYNGGMEHTTLHLLYSRFWHKFLYDLGVVPTTEPYAKRIAHGIILGPDGRKMSKSFGNVINPDDIADEFGADTLRAYIMFIGPYDQESAWSKAGVQGVYRFLKRIWANTVLVRDNFSDSKELLIKLNQTITGVTEDLETFHLNTYIAKLMEMNNMIEKVGVISADSYRKFIQLIFPAAPHITSEIWENKGFEGSIESSIWPEADKNFLVSDQIEIVIQINGKVREKIQVIPDLDQEKLKSLVFENPKIISYIKDKKIVKTIIVPNKLVSLVVE